MRLLIQYVLTKGLAHSLTLCYVLKQDNGGATIGRAIP